MARIRTFLQTSWLTSKEHSQLASHQLGQFHQTSLAYGRPRPPLILASAVKLMSAAGQCLLSFGETKCYPKRELGCVELPLGTCPIRSKPS